MAVIIAGRFMILMQTLSRKQKGPSNKITQILGCSYREAG